MKNRFLALLAEDENAFEQFEASEKSGKEMYQSFLEYKATADVYRASWFAEHFGYDYIKDTKTAVVGINGCMSMYSYSVLNLFVQDLSYNDEVSDIVFKINSPGGAVSGLFEACEMIYRCPKNKLAYVTGSACSAAYLLASACGKIVAQPSSTIGSIGVMCAYYSENDDNYVIMRSKHAQNKNLNVNDKKWQNAEQETLDCLEEMFFEKICKYRGVTSEDIIKNFGNGSTFLGAEAQNRGMADTIIETLDECVSSLCSLSGGEEKNMELKDYKDEELLAAVTSRAELLASIVDKAKKEGMEEEKQRVATIQSYQSFGTYADEPIKKAISSGATTEQALAMILEASKNKPAEPVVANAVIHESNSPEIAPVQLATTAEEADREKLRKAVELYNAQ